MTLIHLSGISVIFTMSFQSTSPESPIKSYLYYIEYAAYKVTPPTSHATVHSSEIQKNMDII